MRFTHTTRRTKLCEAFIQMGNVTMIKNNFHNMIMGCPNLACQRLVTLEEETTDFEPMLELLLALAVE